MTNVFSVVLACLVGVSLGSSGERIGAHRRPSNPALRANVQDPNLFIPLPMVRNVRMQSDDHYELDIETANGVRRTEVGDMNNNGNNEVKGVIQYTLPDGTPFILRYIADETGFHPQGNMLPTPPPMPAHAIAQMKKAGMLHHSSEEDAMFDSMENDPMFKSMEDMFRSMEDDDLIDDSLEINTFKRNLPTKTLQNQPTKVLQNRPTTIKLNHPSTAQVIRFDSVEDGFHSIEDRFDSRERFNPQTGRFDSVEEFNPRTGKFDSIEDRFVSREDRFNPRTGKFDSIEEFNPRTGKFDSIEDRFDSREDRFHSREDRFDSREDMFDSRENNRVPIRNNENSRALLRNITNRGGVLLRNRNTGKIVLLRNRKIIDSFEKEDFRSREVNTFEDRTFEDFSIENRTDERDSLEINSHENDSLEFKLRLNQLNRKGQGRISNRG